MGLFDGVWQALVGLDSLKRRSPGYVRSQWARAITDPSAGAGLAVGAASLRPPELLTACFFCSRPLTRDSTYVATIALGQRVLRPLVCALHAAALRAGERPAVLARPGGEGLVPWFQGAAYRPDWDFDPAATGPSLAWEALVPAALLDPPPRSIIHAEDPRWPAPPEAATTRPPHAAASSPPAECPRPDEPSESEPRVHPVESSAAAPAGPSAPVPPEALVAVPKPAGEASPDAPPAGVTVPPAASPAPAPPRLPTVGETAVQGGWAITLRAYGPYEQFTPLPSALPPVGRLVVAEFVATNCQATTQIVMPSDFVVELGDGRRVSSASQSAVIEKGVGLVQSVQAGASMENRVVFDIPPGATHLRLSLLGAAF